MLLATAMILFGFVVLIWSADLFVSGAASIAKNLGMSPIIIGLTIVSIGTSAPEILVSVTASLSGAGDLAIGNAMATAGVGVLIFDRQLTAVDGWIMISVLLIIVALMVRMRIGDAELSEAADTGSMPYLPQGRAWLTFFFGLVLLIASSKPLVWGAVIAAEELGVSNLIIGLTIVAIGTSLPELAASIASATRGHTEIALGNIIGSNLFNLLAVMAIPGVVETQVLESEVISRDYFTMAFLTAFLAVAVFVSRKRSKARRHVLLSTLFNHVGCGSLYACAKHHQLHRLGATHHPHGSHRRGRAGTAHW